MFHRGHKEMRLIHYNNYYAVRTDQNVRAI